jgi:alpha- and gamma-adaptin-binding protein p34
MGRLLAVKEQSADLPLEQRKKMAAKAVKELFKAGEGT